MASFTECASRQTGLQLRQQKCGDDLWARVGHLLQWMVIAFTNKSSGEKKRLSLAITKTRLNWCGRIKTQLDFGKPMLVPARAAPRHSAMAMFIHLAQQEL